LKGRITTRSESSSNEIGIFVFLTLVIFFVAIGFPTLINTTPSYGYDENTIAKLTPVTTFYQEAYAEQEVFGILSSYYFDPVLSSVLLVMPTTLNDLPPEDPLQYFERKYSNGIQLEFGFIEFDTIQESLTQNINKSDFLPPIINELLDFEVLPPAYAVAPTPPPSSAGTSILFEDPFEVQPASNGWTETCPACTASSGIFFFSPSSVAFRISSTGAPFTIFGLERSLDTTGFSDVAFNLTAHQLSGTWEVADYLSFEVDFGNGTFITILQDVRHWSGVDNRITDTDPSGNTVPTDTGFVSLPALADNNPNLIIRIEGAFNSQTISPPLEGYFIDHIQVTANAILPTHNLQFYYKFNSTAGTMINEPISVFGEAGNITSFSTVGVGTGLFGEATGAHSYSETAGRERAGNLANLDPNKTIAQLMDWSVVNGAGQGWAINAWVRGTQTCGAGDGCVLFDTTAGQTGTNGVYVGFGAFGLFAQIDTQFVNIGNGLSTDNVYHMYTWVFNGTDNQMTTFKDGASPTSDPFSTPFFTPTSASITIGNRNQSPFSSNLPNAVDELSVWGTPLSAEQVDFLFNGGLGYNITGAEAPPINVINLEINDVVGVFDDTPVRFWGKLPTTELQFYYKFNSTAGTMINEPFSQVGERGNITSSATVSVGTGLFGEAIGGHFYGESFGREESFANILSTDLDWTEANSTGTGHTLNVWLRGTATCDGGDGCGIFSTVASGTSTGGILWEIGNFGMQILIDGDTQVLIGAKIQTDNQYHMYTFQYNATDRKYQMFLDGNPSAKGTERPQRNFDATAIQVTVGNNNVPASPPFNTQQTMDELSVWSLVLNQTQIDNLFNVGDGFEIFDTAIPLAVLSPPSPITTLNATQINSIFLDWTAPDDGGSPILGYEIERARTDIARNGTYMDFLFREHELSGDINSNKFGENMSSATEGFVGQALNVTSDEEVGAIAVSLHRITTTACSGSAFLQGTIFFDNGTRVENSTNTFAVCDVDPNLPPRIIQDHVFIFDNTEIFSGNEYVFGVEKVGTNTDGDIDIPVSIVRTTLADGFTARDFSSPPFVFTNDTSKDTAVSVFILNFTTLVADTGNTNTNFTDTSCPAGITCYYRAQGINAIGTAGKSNIVNATETGLETIFNSTSDVNNIWSYRVHDDEFSAGTGVLGNCAGFPNLFHCGGIPDTQFETGAVSGFDQRPKMQMTFGTTSNTPIPQGDGYFFKTFTRNAILNQDIKVFWELVEAGGNDRPMEIQVFDGAYIAENNEDFPYNNEIKLKGGGLLGFCATGLGGADKPVHFTECLDGIDGNDRFNVLDIDYSLSTEDFITVFLQQRPISLSKSDLYLNNMTITNVGFWDFINAGLTNTRGAFNDTRVIEFDEEAGFYTANVVIALLPAPEPITDLQVRIENTTAIYSVGASGATQVFDKFPTIITQIAPTFTNPTLIDSIQIDIKETGVTALPVGTIQAVIIGDRTGDLTDGSLLSNIYFIENSTNTISTTLLPALAIFNFSGNTILDSGDFDVGIGIVIDTHDAEILMDLFGSGAFGKMIGTGADCAGDNLVFDDEACSGVATSDLSGLNIFGGNARAVLSWTEPIGSPTGYEIVRANATQQVLWDEEIEISSLCLSDGRCEDIGTQADPLGFSGQRITFPTDIQLTDIMLNLAFRDSTPFGGQMNIQGVVLKDAPEGTGSFTRVANSTFVKVGKTIGGDVTGGSPQLFNNFNNCCPEAFSFNNTILTAGVEYIIGVESFGTFSGSDNFIIAHNATGTPQTDSAPNSGLGVFTKLHVGTSDLWVDNSTENLLAMFIGLNYTEEVADTGNTDLEYTSIADFPSSDEKINAYRYLVKAINSGGSANASNTSEISPDRTGFDVWDYKEHDSRTFFTPTCTFGANEEGVFAMNFSGTGVGFCFLFKSFNKTEITGSDIGININFTETGRMFFNIVDGSYDKDDFADFPLNVGHPNAVLASAIKGIGTLNQTDSQFVGLDQCDLTQGGAGAGLRQCNIIIPASGINYAGSTENEITLFLKLFNGRTSVGNIEISNVGSWDFTNNPRKVIGINNGASETFGIGASNNQDDRGNVYSNGVFSGAVQVITLPDQVTGLNITQNMNNNATLDWNDALNADNYQVLRKVNVTEAEVNTNSTWSWRAFRSGSSGIDATCDTFPSGSGATGGIVLRNTDSGDDANCNLWKFFPRDFINNTRIQFSYTLTHIFGTQFTTRTLVGTENDPQANRFDDRPPNTIGYGTVVPNWVGGISNDGINPRVSIDVNSVAITSVQTTDEMVDLQSQWDVADSDYISLVFQTDDNSLASSRPDLKIFWINITDFDTLEQKAFYNFSGGTDSTERFGDCDLGAPSTCGFGRVDSGTTTITTEIFEEIGTPTTSDFEDSTLPITGVSTYKVRGNSTNGFGLNSTEVDFGLIQEIDGITDIGGGLFTGSLNATALNSTAIKLIWDQATTEHPTDPLTGVIIQRSNDTNHNIINGTWQYREYDDAGGSLPNCTFTQAGTTDSLFMSMSGTSTNNGHCNLFKILPTHLINNTKVFVDWESTTVPANSGTVRLAYSNTAVFRDPSTILPIIDSTDSVQPAVMISGKPVGSVIPSELIQSLSGGFARKISVYAPTPVQYAGETANPYSTLYIELLDFDSLENPNIFIHSINITDTNDNELVFWNFTDIRPLGSVKVSESTAQHFAHGTFDVTLATTVTTDLDFRFNDANINFDSTGGMFETITTVDDLDVMFTDLTLDGSTTYVYRLKGQSAVSTGSFGDNNTATTLAIVLPDQVTGLNITQNMNNNATLDWNDALNADNYQVLRKTNFTSSVEVNTNGTWQVREVALSSSPNSSGCGFSAPTDNVRITNSFGSNLVSSCYMFKTFPRDFLNGTQIQIRHDTDQGGSGVGHSTLVDTRDDPFQLQTDDESEWDVFSFTPRDFSLTDVKKVNDETIPNGLGLRTDDMISTLGQWQGNDTDYASIIIESRNMNIFTAEGDMKIFWINITDFTTGEPKAFYNFSGSTVTQFLPHNLDCSVNTIITDCFRGIFEAGNTITIDPFVEIGTPITSDFEDSTIPELGVSTYKVRGNNTDGFGLNSTEVDFGLIQPIRNLNATALNSTAVGLTWDLATTEHPTDPLTGVILQRSLNINGTWQWYERDDAGGGFSPACVISDGVDFVQMINAGGGDGCTMFMSFDRTEIDSLGVTHGEVDWSGIFTGITQSGGNGRIKWFDFATELNRADIVDTGTMEGIAGSDLSFSVVGDHDASRQLDVESRNLCNNTTCTERFYHLAIILDDTTGLSNQPEIRVYGIKLLNTTSGQTLASWTFDATSGINDVAGEFGRFEASSNFTINGAVGGVGAFATIGTVDELITAFNDTGEAFLTTQGTGLEKNVEYTYRAKGQSAVSTGSFGDNNTATTFSALNLTQTEIDFVSVPDQTVLISPPFPITTLAGSTVLDTCELTWSDPPNGGSPITTFQIFRSVSGGAFSLLLNDTIANHTDTGLVINVLYEYNVTSINAFGDSEPSNIVDCTPVVSGVPSAPLALDAQNEGADVRLNWLESLSGDPTGYQIQRKIGTLGSYVIIVNDTASVSTTFLDTTVTPSTEFVYKIRAFNAFGVGDFSNEATIVTLLLPANPILSAEQVGDMITLNWTEPASGQPINGYKIDRRINFGALTVFVANTSSTSLTFDDSNVTKPNTYGYRVRALSSLGEGSVSNIVDVVFGSHIIVQVREQDGSGFKGGGIVRGVNATLSLPIGLDTNSNAIFDNLDVGNYNFTFFDDDNFILNKTFNFPAPAGNDTSSFTINALVFDVDCPDNGLGSDIRIKLNYTDAKDIISFPSTPVCDSTDQVSWSTRWQGSAVNDTSTMIADFISTVFKANAEQFLASADIIPTIFNSGENQIESETFVVNMTDVTINFNLFLGRAPSGGGNGGGGGGTPPFQSIPELKILLEQRLTGLSLLSRTHGNAMAGDVIEGSISVEWEGEQGLSVTGIDVGEFSDIIRFTIPPFSIEQEIEGIGEFAISSGDIPYVITLPPFICDEMLGITLNCVDEELIGIDIQFEFESEGVTYQAQTMVMVDLRPIPFDLPQFQIILLGIVLLVSAIAGNFIRQRIRGNNTQSGKRRARKKKFKKKFDSS